MVCSFIRSFDSVFDSRIAHTHTYATYTHTIPERPIYVSEAVSCALPSRKSARLPPPSHTLALAHETHRWNPRRFCYAPITPTGRTDKVTERQKIVPRERGREEEYKDVKYDPLVCEPYPIAAYEHRWNFGGVLRAGSHPVRGGSSKHFQSRNLVVVVIFVAVAVILFVAYGSASVSL